ncbi:MAG: 2,3-bisphosphoglycerate-independent phosphoglycerate mutase, partial [Candidatus Pacearchaeota archaeon]|nr:2,3-bisphosphoglycerate-independent phosphoglycerate mutase [Candidatus Pacearchaeota archaeon]
MEKVVLVIRDGWGYRKDKKDNAIASTRLRFDEFLMKNYPNVLLGAWDGYVGLPKGFQGNSEVGHMTIGSGRVTKESLMRIDDAISDKSFFRNKEFLDAIKYAKKYKSKLHLVGLMQKEGVHSHLNHLFALLDLCAKKKFEDVYLHLFTDGRDAPVHKSLEYLKVVEDKLSRLGFGQIVSICGRYYGMDRDKRWKRTRLAYEAVVGGISKEYFVSARDAIIKSHKNGVSDEFIVPICKEGYEGFLEKDAVIFFNFRTDRMRQLIKAVLEKEFSFWKRKKRRLFCVAMTQFYKSMNARVAFKEPMLKNLLGEVVSKNGLKQLRISETEKYAHVTFFFNGQIEEPNKNEERIIIASPKVATYDKKPEMSVYKIGKRLVREINKNKFDFIVVNLVNGDMVGHTGKTPAIKKAVKAVDEVLEDVVMAGLKKDYTFLILADHGNAEDQRPEWRTSHTINPVPCVLVSSEKELNKKKLRKGCGLQDV